MIVTPEHTCSTFFKVNNASECFPTTPYDTIHQFLPWFHFDKESLKDFSLPLWNPYQGSGVPHIANMQSAFFYPLNIFVYLFNWKWGLLLLYFFKFFLVGLFSYLYLSEIGIDYRAAIIASIGAMYSGFMYMFEFQMTGAAFCFFLGLLAIEFIIKSPDKFKGYLLLIIAFVVTVFTGHPEILFFMVFVLGLYFMIRLLYTYGLSRNTYVIIIRVGLFLLAGVAISAIQILPFLEYLHASTVYLFRAGIKETSFYSLFMLLPAIGNFFAKGMATINTSSVNWINAGLNYIGVVLFICGIAGITNLFRNRFIRVYAVLLITSLLIPFNVPILHNIFARIPGFDIAEKGHLLIFSGYLLILSAAVYINAIIKERLKPKTINISVYFAVLIVFILYLTAGKTYTINTLLVYITLVFILITVVVLKVKNKNYMSVILGFVVLLPTMLFLLYARKPVKPAYFFPSNTIINTIKRYNPPFRVLPIMRDGLKAWEPDINTFYDIEDPRNYDTMGIKWYDKFAGDLLTYPEVLNFLNVKFIIAPEITYSSVDYKHTGVEVPEPVIRQGNNISIYRNRYSFDIDMPVNQFQPVVSANGFTLYENTHAFNRAFMVYNYKVADTRKKAFKLVKRYASQLSETAIILKKDTKYTSFIPDNTITTSGNTVLFEKYTPNYIKLHVNTYSAGLLVISNTYFPGWHAYIDGRKTKVLKTDYAFQGVFLTKGTHEVELRYMPWSFVVGLILSIIGIAAVPLIWRGSNLFTPFAHK